MDSGEFERTKDFLIAQQAQFAVDLQKSREKFDADLQRSRELSDERHRQMTLALMRLAAVIGSGHTALVEGETDLNLRIDNVHERIDELDKRLVAQIEAVIRQCDELAQSRKALAEAQKRTEATVTRLIEENRRHRNNGEIH
jgi:hypothetical protein